MEKPDLGTVIGKYPQLEFTDSGKTTLQTGIDALFEPGAHPPEQVEAIWNQLEQKLQYLNDYGGGAYRVRLASDYDLLCFSLAWKRNGQIVFNGGLQFNGIERIAPSVVIGEPTWFSIHT